MRQHERATFILYAVLTRGATVGIPKTSGLLYHSKPLSSTLTGFSIITVSVWIVKNKQKKPFHVASIIMAIMSHMYVREQ